MPTYKISEIWCSRRAQYWRSCFLGLSIVLFDEIETTTFDFGEIMEIYYSEINNNHSLNKNYLYM